MLSKSRVSEALLGGARKLEAREPAPRVTGTVQRYSIKHGFEVAAPLAPHPKAEQSPDEPLEVQAFA